MPRALRRDTQSLRAGVPNRLDHVVGGLSGNDDGGPLVYGQVPRLPGLVVSCLARNENLAGDSGLQSFGTVAGGGSRGVHRVLSP
jgi:hypothetical protein